MSAMISACLVPARMATGFGVEGFGEASDASLGPVTSSSFALRALATALRESALPPEEWADEVASALGRLACCLELLAALRQLAAGSWQLAVNCCAPAAGWWWAVGDEVCCRWWVVGGGWWLDSAE